MRIKYFPIIIFTFNRPSNLKTLIKSLKNYRNYKKHKYYFFCDGPKQKSSNSEIRNINCNLIEISKFKVKKKIVKRKKNYGLSKNIILGLNKIFKIHEAAIILEDDLELNFNCIDFINYSLNKFKSDKNTGSVTGYSHIHNLKIHKNIKCYKSFRQTSWSWGTWKHIWNNIDWDEYKYIISRRKDSFLTRKIKLAGDDILYYLIAHKLNILDTWAARFNLHCLNKNLYSISPRYSLVKNNGFGAKATHTHNFFKRENIKFNKKKIDLKKISNPKFYKSINAYIKKKHTPNPKLKIQIFLKSMLGRFF